MGSITKRGRQTLRNMRFAVVGGIVLSTVVFAGPATAAVNYGAEIKKLQTQNAANAANRSALQNSAMTLEQKIANMQTTIGSLDAQITANETRQAEIVAKIAATSTQIESEQTMLGTLIRQMYIDNDVSMLEKVASSKNLSEFVEKEQYSILMQAKIKQSLDRIKLLKKEHEGQKKLVDQLITSNKNMQLQVANEKQEVARLLAMNQTEQAQYTQTIAAANTQITDLQRQQAEENMRFQRQQEALAAAASKNPSATRTAPAPVTSSAGVKYVNGNAYPYKNAPFPNSIVDPWGMYQRQCVSYTAWKVSASGRTMPNWGGRGNAKQWDDNARAAGIPVDGNPRVGDVAVRNAGTYGHVMYVEAVNGDGSINISQYNADWTGTYSEARIFPGDLVFIHF